MKMLPVSFLAAVCCSVSSLFRAVAQQAVHDLIAWYVACRKNGIFECEEPLWLESAFERAHWLQMEHKARICAARALKLCDNSCVESIQKDLLEKAHTSCLGFATASVVLWVSSCSFYWKACGLF